MEMTEIPHHQDLMKTLDGSDTSKDVELNCPVYFISSRITQDYLPGISFLLS